MRVGVCAGVSRIWLRGNEVRSSCAKDNEDGKILQMYATATNGLCVCVCMCVSKASLQWFVSVQATSKRDQKAGGRVV